MKIFVDDVREPPDRTWIVFRCMETALDFIKKMLALKIVVIKEISLDHDMGQDFESGTYYMSGYNFLTKLESWFHARYEIDLKNGNKSDVYLPIIRIHSSNPSGVEDMKRVLASIQRWFIK